MMRRGWCGVLGTAVLAIVVLTGAIAQAASVEGRKEGGAKIEAEPFRSAILVDAASGTILFDKDAHRQLPPASMTKMMLILLVAEGVNDGQLRWEDPVRVSDRASRIGGSQVYLKAGEVFTLGEMMQAIVIHSANDASVAVAEAVAGSSEAFVQRMNERAQALGMKNTVYRSVHGLPPGKGQQPDVTSANDLAIVARRLVGFPDIMRWAGTKEATFRNGTMTLTNTNRLVRETTWVDGLKTGYYQTAGFNVTATAVRDHLRLIAVVMGAQEKKTCFAQAERLLNQGFGGYQTFVALKRGDTVASDVAVRGGRPRFVRVVAGADVSILSRRGEKRAVSLELDLPGDVNAPITANAPVGEVVVRDGDAVVGRVPALAADAVERSSIWDRLF